MSAKFLKIAAAFLALGLIGYFALPHFICVDVPQRQKLADCNAKALAFTMSCEHSPPYQFVLGVGQSNAGPFAFRGEILLQQSAGKVARIPISSDHMTPCNWLPGLDGYILTWNRTNAGERISELLHRGQSYDVRVAFTETPPADSSLWFSSMGTARW